MFFTVAAMMARGTAQITNHQINALALSIFRAIYTNVGSNSHTIYNSNIPKICDDISEVNTLPIEEKEKKITAIGYRFLMSYKIRQYSRQKRAGKQRQKRRQKAKNVNESISFARHNQPSQCMHSAQYPLLCD